MDSKPAKHLRSFLGQIVNATCTLQGECAGAQAWNNIDTYCAPFIRQDNLTYEQVKQALQEFIFSLNVPTRVGFQCPFLIWVLISRRRQCLKNTHYYWRQPQQGVYGEFQEEMNLFNRAFCKYHAEGDAKGRIFTFRFPPSTLQKTSTEPPSVEAFMRKSPANMGFPICELCQFRVSPEHKVSMCCRLSLNTSELRRGGDYLGRIHSQDRLACLALTARIGYLTNTKRNSRNGWGNWSR